MATDAEIWEKGQEVLDSGTKAAEYCIGQGWSAPAALRMLSSGLMHDELNAMAVLDLLSMALVRLAMQRIEMEDIERGLLELKARVKEVEARHGL